MFTSSLAPGTLKPTAIMLMHRTPTRMIHKPVLDTLLVKTAKALQARHGSSDLELLQADSALGVVDAVFL